MDKVELFEVGDGQLYVHLTDWRPPALDETIEVLENGEEIYSGTYPPPYLLIVPASTTGEDRLFEAHTRKNSWGERSDAVRTLYSHAPHDTSPTDLNIEQLGDGLVRIKWEPADLEGDVTIRTAGETFTSTGVTAPFLFAAPEDACYFDVSVRLTDGSNLAPPIRGSFYRGIHQEVTPDRSIPANSGTPWLLPPGDLAYHAPTNRLVVVPSGGSGSWTTYDLSDHQDNLSALGGHAGPGATYGAVTTYPVAGDTTPAGSQWTQELLLAGNNLDGDLVLDLVEAQGAVDLLHSVDVVLSPDLTAPIPEALAYEPKSDQLLLVVNGTLYSVPLNGPLTDVTQIVAHRVELLRNATVSAVSCRANGHYEVPVESGTSATQYTHLLTLKSNHSIVGCLTLENSQVGAIDGLVHYDGPLATVALSNATSVEVARAPREVEPTSDHPFTATAVPYDFDGDGLAGTDADWTLWLNVMIMYVNADPDFPVVWATLDHSAWDVFGGGHTYAGDGVVDIEDYNTLLGQFMIAQPSSPVIAHPNWASDLSQD